MRENYLGRIHHLEQLEAKEAREKYRRDFAMRLRKHKQDIERKGAFSEVKSGGDYELFVAFCLKEAGADCKRVGQSGDFGADVIASVGSNCKVVIQCKFYTSPVGYDAVKEAFTAKSLYQGNHSWVVSNAGYTSQARAAAMKLGVKLLSHENIDAEVRKLVEKYTLPSHKGMTACRNS